MAAISCDKAAVVTEEGGHERPATGGQRENPPGSPSALAARDFEQSKAARLSNIGASPLLHPAERYDGFRA